MAKIGKLLQTQVARKFKVHGYLVLLSLKEVEALERVYVRSAHAGNGNDMKIQEYLRAIVNHHLDEHEEGWRDATAE